jgi:hypothetical protein
LEGDYLLGVPERDELLDEVAKCMAQSQTWRESALNEKLRVARDLYNAVDDPQYTGRNKGGSHLFIPVVYDHSLAQIQEIADTFDSPILPTEPDSNEPQDIAGAALARELFGLHVSDQKDGEGWYPFCWTVGHQAVVEGFAQTKWFWSFVTDKAGNVVEDRLRWESIPQGDLFWDPTAALTRRPTWWVHRIYRTESYVKQRIMDGVWKGKNESGAVVDFETLKGYATVESSMEREEIYYPERDPFTDVPGKEGMLELWEYYRLKGDVWYKSLTVKASHTLEDPQVNPDGPYYQPFQVGYILPRAYHFDGESTPARAFDLQLEVNANRNLDIDGRNRELNPRTIVSLRAGLDLSAFRDGSELVTAVRTDDQAIREFRYSPTAQAMIPRDTISMRDLADITGRTAPTQGLAQGSVRGTGGVNTLTMNARMPLNRRLKTLWATLFQPGLVKANYLIRRYETDEKRLMKAAKRIGLGRMQPPQAMMLLDQAGYEIRRDPDMQRIDPQGLEMDLKEIAATGIQAQRPDIAFEALAQLMRLKGHPEIAQKLLQPANPALMPPQQGPGKASTAGRPSLPGVAQ